MTSYVPCPKCSTPDPKRMNFTWWGGIVGPRVLSHVKCNGCGSTFNGKTGKSNTPRIAAYFAVIFVIAILIGLLPFLMR